MSRRLTVVMYHYVHEAAGRGFAKLVGRTFDEFQGQLDYLQRNFTIISPEQFINAVRGRRTLPPNACMLTFDDGYRVHYSVVFRALRERGLFGFFFPPSRPVRETVMLDVHKIHFTLASSATPAGIASELCRWIETNAAAFSLQSAASYWTTYARPSRFDPAETVFVKRALQKGLPARGRAAAVDWLFRRYVGQDEASLSAAFYMRTDELREMVRSGMYVGSHGHAHGWLDTMDPAAQSRDIDSSLDLLSSIGAPTSQWIMCYPYGGQNAALVEMLLRRGCIAGVTTRVAVADLSADDPMLLPRLDTNDLPLTAAPADADSTGTAVAR
jgi:peptidoglycan/xylan/chitin deacetylase (PgdA/CDA1 family)